MSRNELFSLLLVTVCLGITGCKELAHRNIPVGMFMLAIPLCGWLSIWLGAVR